ncbi:MAG: acyl-CoA desaturase, partial [Dietzia cercidiphylli]
MTLLQLPTIRSTKPKTSTPKATAPEPVVLSAESVEIIGRELDAIRDRVVADLGTADRDYILRVVRM